MKVYAFIYCSDTYEGGYVAQSLHESQEGAEKALMWHKEEKRKEWEEVYKGDDEDTIEMREMCPFGFSEDWKISEYEILP